MTPFTPGYAYLGEAAQAELRVVAVDLLNIELDEELEDVLRDHLQPLLGHVFS